MCKLLRFRQKSFTHVLCVWKNARAVATVRQDLGKILLLIYYSKYA